MTTKKSFFAMLVAIAAISASVFTSCKEQKKGSGDNPQENQTIEGVVINGVRWATRNVDALGTFAKSPEDAGMFYQWNRPIGWFNAAQQQINGDTTSTWEWDFSFPPGNAWEPANDPSPAGYRVPTLGEMEKLFEMDKVLNEWTTLNGVNGRRFTDMATGAFIFLPAAGLRNGKDGTLQYIDYGYYWSSTQCGSNHAYNLNLGGSYPYICSDTRRCGFSLRPVAE